MAELPATHSTRPTSLESATAPEAAPVGGYGVPENCVRSPAQLGGDVRVDLGVTGPPRERASASRATAEMAAANRRRSLSCHGGGHTSMQAVMQKTPAMHQPDQAGTDLRGRLGHGDGRTKVNRAAVDAVAACGARIPAKSTAKPTTAIVTTAATLFVETTVPSTVKQAPEDEEAGVAGEPRPGRPVNSTRSRRRERTERGEEGDLRVRERDVGQGEDRRHDHRRPDGALDDEEVRILRSDPAHEAGAGRRGSGGSGVARRAGARHVEGTIIPLPAGIERSRPRRSTHGESCRLVLTSAPATRSQPGIGRPRITATEAFVVATKRSDCSGPTRTRMPPWPLAAMAMFPPTRKASPPNIFFSVTPVGGRPGP